jgi:hypothetical protein
MEMGGWDRWGQWCIQDIKRDMTYIRFGDESIILNPFTPYLCRLHIDITIVSFPISIEGMLRSRFNSQGRRT